MLHLLMFISELIYLYTIVVFAYVVLGLLVQFGLMNGHNPVVRAIMQTMGAVIEPLLQPIRRLLPNSMTIDISPIILGLGCGFIRQVIIPNLARLV